jgi:hypothetical protein
MLMMMMMAVVLAVAATMKRQLFSLMYFISFIRVLANSINLFNG